MIQMQFSQCVKQTSVLVGQVFPYHPHIQAGGSYLFTHSLSASTFNSLGVGALQLSLCSYFGTKINSNLNCLKPTSPITLLSHINLSNDQIDPE